MLRHSWLKKNMAEKNVPNTETTNIESESKRLFIGGLYEGVSKEDLRLKFKPFGDVEDLDIVTRRDGSGDHMSTFAYINIHITDKNFRKCLTTYNKCNWKGHVLKVELAKEDYLTRLQKECQTKVNIKQANDTSDTSMVKDIKSAVPGTPVPEKPNWVVGKFGRALPIVFLRRKDGKKIAKFDPSKTVHCLKRLSRNDDKQDYSVSNLTWNLDDGNSVQNEICKRRPANRVSMKRPIEEIEDDNSHMATEKTRRMRRGYDVSDIGSDKSVNDGIDSCQDSSKQNSGDCDLLQNSESDSSSDDHVKRNGKATVDNDIASYGLSDSKDLLLMCHEDSSSSDEDSSSASECASEENRQQIITTTCEQNDNLSHRSCYDALTTSSGDSVEQNEVEDNNYEQHSDGQGSLSSDNVSSSDESFSQTEKSNQVSKMKDDSECAVTLQFDTLDEDEKVPKKSSFKDDISNKSRNKKEVSNKQRLETLKERKEVNKTRKEMVNNALQKVDAGSVKGENHIIFENDENLDEKSLKSSNEGKKVSGSKALVWLGMDSSSDDDNHFTQKVDEFLGKEHLDGKSGEKLMKLQQTFGHDQRFKMDKRFLDSDDEIDSTQNIPMLEEDELDNQLKEEKLLSFKVLQTVLGTNSVFVEENEDSRNLYRNSIDTHYDPNREDHVKFEEGMARSNGHVHIQNNGNTGTDELPETKEPVVLQEKFYSVSDSLKNFFSDKDKENSTFSFFPDMEKKKDGPESVAETEEVIDWKAPVKLSQALPYDSSESESEDDVQLSTNDLIPTKVNTKRYLFYHPNDQATMDALEAESSSFMRKESVESLTRYWVEVRQQITQDYKKKRKDALRRQKKTSYRRVER